jgi:thiol-disulfide isomerase/thioredoxin
MRASSRSQGVSASSGSQARKNSSHYSEPLLIRSGEKKGHALRLSDYKGKVVILNFWATWCAPCRAEMPDLVKWQREYKSKGLQVIGVTYPLVELAEAREFIKSINVNYPVALGEEQTKAMFDKGETLPVTVVIDKKGMVREVIQGIIFPEEFEEKVKPLLR